MNDMTATVQVWILLGCIFWLIIALWRLETKPSLFNKIQIDPKSKEVRRGWMEPWYSMLAENILNKHTELTTGKKGDIKKEMALNRAKEIVKQHNIALAKKNENSKK